MRKAHLVARLAKLPGDFRIVPPTLKCPRCGADAGFDLRQVVQVYYAIEGEAEDRQSERTLLVNSDVFAFDAVLPPRRSATALRQLPRRVFASTAHPLPVKSRGWHIRKGNSWIRY